MPSPGEGARFENALASVPLTGPSHSTILTGHYPPVHGVRDNVDLSPGPASIRPWPPSSRGRATVPARFVSAYPVAGAFGFSRGSTNSARASTKRRARAPAPPSGRPTRRWTRPWPGSEKRRARPFLAWLHLYDPHSPYRPPPPYDAAFKDRPYDGEIAFADAQLGRVLEWLRSLGPRRRHRGGHGGGPRREPGGARRGHSRHTDLPGDASRAVHPRGPGVPAGTVVAARVGTVDLLPTILGLLGFDPPAGLPGLRSPPGAQGAASASPAALRGEPVRATQLPLVEPPGLGAGRLEAHRRAASPSSTTWPRTLPSRGTRRRRARARADDAGCAPRCRSRDGSGRGYGQGERGFTRAGRNACAASATRPARRARVRSTSPAFPIRASWSISTRRSSGARPLAGPAADRAVEQMVAISQDRSRESLRPVRPRQSGLSRPAG